MVRKMLNPSLAAGASLPGIAGDQQAGEIEPRREAGDALGQARDEVDGYDHGREQARLGSPAGEALDEKGSEPGGIRGKADDPDLGHDRKVGVVRGSDHV